MNEDLENLTYEEYQRLREEQNPPEETGFGARVGQFFRGAGRLLTQPPKQDAASRAVEQGVKKGFNEIGNTARQVMGTQDDLFSSLDRYLPGTRERTPLQFEVDEGRPEGVYGFVETAVQFGVGMAGFSKVLAPMRLARVARGATAGLLTDLTVMDPFEERLSNLVQQGPEWVRNPLTEWLAADEEDSALEARVKAGLEGLLTGATIDALLWGGRAVRASRKARAGKISAEEAEEQISTAVENAAKAAEGTASGPPPRPEGGFKVTSPGQQDMVDNFRFWTARTGEPGYSVEKGVQFSLPDQPVGDAIENMRVVTYRGENGELLGGLKFDLDDAGKPKSGIQVWVHPEHRRQGIATRLYQTASNSGFDLSEVAGKDLTEDGAALLGSRWERMFPRQSGDPVRVVHSPGAPSEIRIKSELAEEAGAAGDDVGSTLRQDGDEAVLEVSTPGQAESLAAAMNDAINASGRSAEATPEMVEAFRTVLRRMEEGADPRDAEHLIEGIQFNFRRTNSGEESLRAINALTEAAGDVNIEAILARQVGRDGKRQPWSTTVRLADEIIDGVSGEEFLQRAREIRGTAEGLPQFVVAARQYLYGLGREVARLGKLVDLGPDNPILYDQFAKTFDSLFDLRNELAPTSSNIGRALDAHRIPVDDLQTPKGKSGRAEVGGQVRASEGTPGAAKGTPEGDVPKLSKDGPSALPANAKIQGKLAKGTGRPSVDLSRRDLQNLARQIQFADGDPNKILGALRSATIMADPSMVKDPSIVQRVLGFRANMMLSGPKTHGVNITNNAITAFQLPMEYFWGGAITRNYEMRQQGWDLFAGNFLVLGDAMKAAQKALRDNQAILDPTHLTLENAEVAQNALGGFLQGALSLPSRVLMAADEFFKQVNYRSHVRSQSLRHSREAAEARGLKGDEARAFISERVADDLDFSLDVRGGAVNPLGLQYARYATFTNSLEHGVGKWLQDGANEHAWVRLIFPFVRTPVNIFRFAWQRTPVLGAFQKQMREDFMAGGERRALFVARQASGVMLYSAAASLAVSGRITGGGPKSPGLRQQWLNAGNRPYSIRVGGKQYDYRRLEPFGTPLSIVADFVEMMGEMSEEESQNMMATLVASIMSSVSSKTFLIGMTDFFDAATAGEWWKVEKLLTGVTTSFMPNLMRQANPDPLWRETRTLLDEIAARTPGWSDSLEPRRNLFGEPAARPPGYFNRAFNPFTSTNVPDDRIAMELVELGKSMSIPPEKLDGGIDLTDRSRWDNGSGQSPYDRAMELMGSPKQGQSVRERLTERMTSEAWRNASSGNDLYPGGTRWMIATAVVQSSWTRAYNEMLKEYPTLSLAVGQAKRDRANALRSSGGLLDAVSR